MYADDTTLYCSISQNIDKEVINAELMKLWDWLGAKYMVFHISKKNVIYPNLKVIIAILKELPSIIFECYITLTYDLE